MTIVRHLAKYRPPVLTDDRAAWLAHRREGISGTDVAAIAGLHPYQSAWSVYWAKLDQDIEPEANEAMEWGQRLENEIADAWQTRMAQSNLPVLLTRPGLIRHPERNWQIGTPDRLVRHTSWTVAGAMKPAHTRTLADMAEPRDGYRATPDVLEVKTVSEMAWEHHWEDGTTIPVWHLAQGHWYADLIGARRIWYAVLVAGRRLEGFYVDVEPDMTEQLRDAAEEFWAMLIAGTPPAPDGSERTRARLAKLYPTREVTAAELPPEAASVVRAYRTARRQAARYKAVQDEAANRLIAVLGQLEATDGYLEGNLAVSYRRRNTVDVDAVTRDWPDAVTAATKPVISIEALTDQLGRSTIARYRRPSDERSIRVPEE